MSSNEPTPPATPTISDHKSVKEVSNSMTNWGFVTVLILTAMAGITWFQWSSTDSIDNDIAFLRVMDPTTAIVGFVLGGLLLAVVFQLRMMRAEMRELADRITEAR